MQNNTATLEDSLAVSYETKHILTIQSSQHTPWYGNRAGPCGASEHGSLSFPHCWLQAPWPSLSSKGQIPTIANLEREGMQRQGRGSQETIVQPWGKVLVLPWEVHIITSLSSLRCQHSSYQRKTTWGYIKGTREAHQEDYLRPD